MKPLLAVKADMDLIEFPVMVSKKLDGFRCLITPAGAQTRNLKPIANHYVRGKLNELQNATGLDGELLTFTGGKMDDFNTVQSKLTSHKGMPDFTFHVFDDFTYPKDPFHIRTARAQIRLQNIDSTKLAYVDHFQVDDMESLMFFENQFVSLGYEGLMINSITAGYKFGRSTLNEGILLKVKRFEDDEGQIIARYEKMTNNNEAELDELGYTKRSSKKSGMVPAGVLGGFTVEWRGLEFDLGTGFDDDMRVKYWNMDDDEILGKPVTFAFQGVGPNGKPRFPSFRGIRGDL